MNGDLRFLADHIASVDGQRPERAAEIGERIRVARRRRTTAAGTAVVGLVLAVVMGGVWVNRDLDSRQPEPIKRPGQTKTVDPISDVRKLTYANGSTIHWGDQSIDTGLDLDALYVTDNGVGFTTTDRKVWFTDLEDITQIGDLGDADDASYKFGFDQRLTLSSGNSGTLFAWYEVANDQQSLVVYDTSDGSEVLRTEPLVNSDWGEQILAVFDNRIYSMCGGRGDLCIVSGAEHRLARYDLDTGERVLVPFTKYQADLRRHTRTLVVGDRFDSGEVLVGPGVSFARQGSRWAAVYSDADPPEYTSAFVNETALPVDLKLPQQPADGQFLRISQWLDEDTVAAWTGNRRPPSPIFDFNDRNRTYDPKGLYVCVLSTGRCELAVDGAQVDLVPGAPGRGAQPLEPS